LHYGTHTIQLSEIENIVGLKSILKLFIQNFTNIKKPGFSDKNLENAYNYIKMVEKFLFSGKSFSESN